MGRVERGISHAQRAALDALAPALPARCYLAGGVAVAIACHHRDSRDLDLFVPRDFDPERLVERLARHVPKLRVTGTAAGTLYLEVATIPASVLAYRYPLLAKPQRKADLPVPVASLVDLVCMKLAAIASRGAARDFWDLHVLLESGAAGGTLAAALARYRKKFPSDDIGHVVRSLAYFGDAEANPLPKGLTVERWRAIKKHYQTRIAEIE